MNKISYIYSLAGVSILNGCPGNHWVKPLDIWGKIKNNTPKVNEFSPMILFYLFSWRSLTIKIRKLFPNVAMTAFRVKADHSQFWLPLNLSADEQTDIHTHIFIHKIHTVAALWPVEHARRARDLGSNPVWSGVPVKMCQTAVSTTECYFTLSVVCLIVNVLKTA